MTDISPIFEFLKNENPPKSVELNGLIKRVDVIYHQAVFNHIEAISNQSWLAKELLTFKKKYIQAFNQIKAKRYYEAWCVFEQLEVSFSFIEQNSQSYDLGEMGVLNIIKIIEQWQSLYPYKLFSSPGFTVNHYTCSICNERIKLRSKCGHIKGKLYNGKLCLHVVQDMALLEISIVTNPVQKYSVLNPEKQDFRQLKYVADRLKTPFVDWEISKTQKRFSRSQFINIKETDDCPCQSKKEFKNCCWNKEHLIIPHTLIDFKDELPTHLQNELFTY
ncbi:MAG: zinc chelation protein SecC [Colwellia sp.]|jgi:uncharacterized protein YecA (UPF0149 family)|nr:MAG: zinc chelation protein SecC [Colwellia sp.]